MERYLEYSGRDVTISHEIYHEDAVLEFPQSGERFVGVANFREWRRTYPASVRFKIRRLTRQGDLWVAEVSGSYDGGPWIPVDPGGQHHPVPGREGRERADLPCRALPGR